MFSDFLKAYRKAASLTQQKLADASGLERGQIASLETGRRGPAPEDIKALITALELKGEEAARFEDLGLAARADQDQDLRAFVEKLRDENRIIRGRFKLAVGVLGRIRDHFRDKRLDLPKDIQQAITDLEKLL